MFKSCEYIISAVKKEQNPNKHNLPEYVFMGRSNVGKSSLINAICNRKLLARTSSKPGKTKTINFFLIDKKIYLVDVPGYGYASKSHEERQNFGKYIEDYLIDNKNLKIAFLLVDAKVGPTNDDCIMFNYLQEMHIKTILLATKTDKIGTTLRLRHRKNIANILKTDNIIMTSSETKLGIEEVERLINEEDE